MPIGIPTTCLYSLVPNRINVVQQKGLRITYILTWPCIIFFRFTKYICVLIHIWSKGEVGAPFNRLKPSTKIFYWPFQGDTSFVDLLYFFCLVFAMPLCASVYMCLRSPAEIYWLSFMVSNCEFVTFPLVSWVRCGTWLYRFLNYF